MNRGYFCIGLDNPKIPANVGSVLRNAGCYGASFVSVSGARYKRAATDTLDYPRHNPFYQVEDVFDSLPQDCVPVAVDIIEGAIPLPLYTHPERAFYIFGAEDATLGKRITDRCRDIIYVPTSQCMNLATCVGVIAYDRMAKRYSKN